MDEEFDIEEGRHLRDEAIDAVSGEAPSEEDRKAWVERARRYAALHARMYGTVTSDDVVKAVPYLDGVDHRIMGAVFRPGKSSPFEPCGWAQTERKNCHASPMRIWRLK